MPKPSGKVTEREKEICGRVKQFREQIKWPQPAFAYELGITRDQLASIEYGRTPLRYPVAYQMCLMFDVSEVWLATGNGQVSPFESSGPWAGNIPDTILFSEAYDTFRKSAELRSSVHIFTKSACGREFGKTDDSSEKGDPASFLMKTVIDCLNDKLFAEDIRLKRAYCNELAKISLTLLMKHRCKKVKKQVRHGGGVKNFTRDSEPNLRDTPPQIAKKIMRLREKIASLEVELDMLENPD